MILGSPQSNKTKQLLRKIFKGRRLKECHKKTCKCSFCIHIKGIPRTVKIRNKISKAIKGNPNCSVKQTKTIINKIKKSLIQHNKLVLNLKAKYLKSGYKVLSCFDIIPDLIIIKNNKITSIELERNRHGIYKKKRRYINNNNYNFFNEVIYYDIKGDIYERH
jgi:hypothetical protein